MQYSPSFANITAFTNDLHRFIESRRFGFRGGLFKVALILHQGVLRFGEGCLIYHREKVEAAPKADYGDVVFLEEWIEPASAAENFLPPFLSGQKSIAGYPIKNQFGRTESHHQNWLEFSITGWQEWVFRTRVDYLDKGEHIQLSQEELTRTGLPPYLNVAHAIAARISRIKKWGSVTSPHFGMFTTVLPDTRARLLSGEWGAGQININIEANTKLENLQLQMLVEFQNRREAILVPVSATKIEHPVPLGAQSIDIFLVHDSECLSRIHLPSMFSTFGPDREDQQIFQIALADITNGENQQVEYKSFVRPQNKKEREIVKTAIAFANTSGGRIYLGVENDGTLQGEDALRATYAASLDEAKKQALAHLQSLIIENIKPVPNFKVDYIQLRRQPVFVVSIDKGTERPYSNKSHEMWIRKGGNDFVPDPRTELPLDEESDFPPRVAYES